MKKAALMTGATLAAMTACANPDAPTAPVAAPPPNLGIELAVPGRAGDTPAKVYLARGMARAAKPSRSNNLLWHNGAIMNSASVQTVFWGKSWSTSDPKISGLTSLYQGLGGSSYINTNTEYTGTNGQVGTGVSFGGSHVDVSAAPTSAPSTSQVLAEVCKVITNPVSNGYYAVYSDQKRGNAGYCAWHSYGSCGGTPVQIAFFFNLDGDAGCNPDDSATGHSQGLASLGNVSGHEISEALTDPRNGGWYDRQGSENADKCAWTFGADYVTLKNGSQWKIQGNWSNAAATAHTGYDGAGCIQTK